MSYLRISPKPTNTYIELSFSKSNSPREKKRYATDVIIDLGFRRAFGALLRQRV
jgi:hypothetical protein